METATSNERKKSKKSKIDCEENSSSSSNNTSNRIESVNGCLQEQIDRSGHGSCADTSNREPELQVQDDVIMLAGEEEGLNGVRATLPSDNECVIYEQFDPPDESLGEIKVVLSDEEEEDHLSTSSTSSYCPSSNSNTPPPSYDCEETTVFFVLPLPEEATSQQLLPPTEVNPAATILEIQCTSSDGLEGRGQHVERFESRLTLGTAVENGQVVNNRQYEESELKQRQQRTSTGHELNASTQLYHHEKERVTTTEGGQRLSETSVQKQETHESTEFTFQLIDGQNTRCGKTRRRSSTSSHNSILRLGDELSLPAPSPHQPPEAIRQAPRGWDRDLSPDSTCSSDSEELPPTDIYCDITTTSTADDGDNVVSQVEAPEYYSSEPEASPGEISVTELNNTEDLSETTSAAATEQSDISTNVGFAESSDNNNTTATVFYSTSDNISETPISVVSENVSGTEIHQTLTPEAESCDTVTVSPSPQETPEDTTTTGITDDGDYVLIETAEAPERYSVQSEAEDNFAKEIQNTEDTSELTSVEFSETSITAAASVSAAAGAADLSNTAADDIDETVSETKIQQKTAPESQSCEVTVDKVTVETSVETAIAENSKETSAAVRSIAEAQTATTNLGEIEFTVVGEGNSERENIASNVSETPVIVSSERSPTPGQKQEKVSTTVPRSTAPVKQRYPTKMDTKDKFVVSFNSDTESDSDSGLSDDEEAKPSLLKGGPVKVDMVNGFCSDTSLEQSNEMSSNESTSKGSFIINKSDRQEITAEKSALAGEAMENKGCLLDSPCLENGKVYTISSSVAQAGATNGLESDISSAREAGPTAAASAAAGAVGTLIDINSCGVDQETAKAVPVVARVGLGERPPSAAGSSGQHQQQSGMASYSQELLSELSDARDQTVYSTSSEDSTRPWEKQSPQTKISSSREALEPSSSFNQNAHNHTNSVNKTENMAGEEARFNGVEEKYTNSNVTASQKNTHMDADEYSPRSPRYMSEDQSMEGRRRKPMDDEDNFQGSTSLDDPDSTENLIKRILEEARRDRESGGGRYHVNLGDAGGNDGDVEESNAGGRARNVGPAIGDMDADEEQTSWPRKVDAKERDSVPLEKRLANLDKERAQSKYMTRDYGAMEDDDLYAPRKPKYGQVGKSMYDDIDADSNASSGRRRVNAWRKDQRGFNDDDEDVFRPSTTRRPLRMQHNFDNDDEDNESCHEPEEPLFDDEDFIPEKREETDEVVRERTHNIRSVVDNQSEVVEQLRRASRSFDEIQDEIKELRQSLLESQMRRDAADTDLMDYAQTRMDPAEIKAKPLYKTVPVYDRYDDEEFDPYSGYNPKSKGKDSYDPDEDPLETDPLPRKPLGSLALTKYGGPTAYGKDANEKPSYGNFSKSYDFDETPSYTNRYKSYSLGGANRFRRTHSLYDDVDSSIDGQDKNGVDDDDAASSYSSSGYKYGSYKPRKYGSLDLESNDKPSYSSRYKSPIGSYTPSYRPSIYKSTSRPAAPDYTSDLSSSASTTTSDTPRYNRFSRSQTLSADYGSTLPSTRPRSPSNFEPPPTTSRFLQKVRDRKKANGEETSDDLSSASGTRDKPFRSRFMKKSFDSDYSSMGPSSRSSLSSLNTTPDKASTDSNGNSTVKERHKETTAEA